MDIIITVAIICLVAYRVRKTAKTAGNKNTAESPKKAPVHQTSNIKPQVKKTGTIPNKNVAKPKTQVSNIKPTYKAVPKKPVKSSNTALLNHTMLLEDRENDWLACQLREEHKAFKNTKDMFDLKIEHASHCDARYVKQFHHMNCGAEGVDTAAGH